LGCGAGLLGDLVACARNLGVFQLHLRTTPIERRGRGHEAATARAEAQAARPALIYALPDASDKIDLEQLEASSPSGPMPKRAAPGSSATVSATRPPTTSGRCRRPGPAGITHTHLRDLFSRKHKTRGADRALGAREDASRLRRQPTTNGRGRPAELWIRNWPNRR